MSFSKNLWNKNRWNGENAGKQKLVVRIMAEMYVSLILKGRKCFAEVPVEVKEKVKELLTEMGREDLIYI